MWKTKLTEDYQVEFPLVSAGMAFITTPQLVAAVSNAGGIGTFGAALVPPEALQQILQDIRSMTTKPYGVDFITPFIPPPAIDVCIQEKVPIVVFFWEVPPKDYITRLKKAGTKVWMQVGSVNAAKEAIEAGVELLIAQGIESGGHNLGTAATFSLLPALVDAVSPVPVLAAGGIADGRGVAASLALGAAGVWVGTRILASQEAFAHDDYKNRLVEANISDTTITRIFGPEWPGAPIRVLQNRVVKEWMGKEKDFPHPPYPDPPQQMIGNTVMGGQAMPLPKYSAMIPNPNTTGDFEEMCLLAGESVGLVKDIKPVREIVLQIMREAQEIISQKLPSLLR